MRPVLNSTCFCETCFCGRKPQQRTPERPPRKPRSDIGKKHAKPETKLQVACVAWAEVHDILVDGSPGGAAFRNGTHKARGCLPGRADLLVLEVGSDGTPGLAVELKVGRHEPSDAQRVWLARLKRRGWRICIAHSLSEFQALVREHMGGAPAAAPAPSRRRPPVPEPAPAPVCASECIELSEDESAEPVPHAASRGGSAADPIIF